MGAMVSQITSLTIVYSTADSRADQRKYESFASLAFVRGIVTGEFPAQMASNAENVSSWWRHHAMLPMVVIRWSLFYEWTTTQPSNGLQWLDQLIWYL